MKQNEPAKATDKPGKAERQPQTPAFGALLRKLQQERTINGKHVTNAFIVTETMMSRRTYNFLKKGRATT